MMKNTGKKSQKLFEAYWKGLGKQAFLEKIEDASDLHGRNNGKTVATTCKPSDYILTYRGVTVYAEVKSTLDPDRFSFSMLRDGQIRAARKQVAAGGGYVVFIHRLNTDVWYRVSYDVIADVQKTGKQSLTWNEMQEYVWHQ